MQLHVTKSLKISYIFYTGPTQVLQRYETLNMNISPNQSKGINQLAKKREKNNQKVTSRAYKKSNYMKKHKIQHDPSYKTQIGLQYLQENAMEED